MKLYIISGLGADYKVLQKLDFGENIEVVFLDWLMPNRKEDFQHYIHRMADRIDDSQPFFLLGYSFGGIVVQEIHKIKKAQKIVILASIKCNQEKSRLMKIGEITKIPKILPTQFYKEKVALSIYRFGKMLGAQNPKMLEYFTVRNPYYLKWSVEKIAEWKSVKNTEVIQILGNRDIIFPIRYCQPDYVIKGGTHLFPAIQHKEVSRILKNIFK